MKTNPLHKMVWICGLWLIASAIGCAPFVTLNVVRKDRFNNVVGSYQITNKTGTSITVNVNDNDIVELYAEATYDKGIQAVSIVGAGHCYSSSGGGVGTVQLPSFNVDDSIPAGQSATSSRTVKTTYTVTCNGQFDLAITASGKATDGSTAKTPEFIITKP